MNSVPVTGFTSKKAQALLAYLAVEARPHSREELAGLLWPDYPDASARTNLRSVLANVRRVIDDQHAVPSYLIISRQTICFNSASDSRLDTAIFDRLSAPVLLEQSIQPTLESAVTQVEDVFLAGFSLPDSPTFEEWLLLKREYFDRQVGKALRYLTNHYAEKNEFAQALAHARHWVTLDPWQEEAHQQVMRLLARSGRRSEALAHYASCRRALVEELGVEPSDETQHLFEQIQNGRLDDQTDAAPVHVAQHSVPPSMTSVQTTMQHTIPHPLSPLIGREQAVAELSGLLADPNVRLLTVVGPGGMGKTHLALEVAIAQQTFFKHGAVLVALAPLESAAGMISAIVEALRFSFYENVPPEQQLLDYLREKQLLLVMDNFEHLLDGTDLVTTILETAPDLKILATSRIRLQIHGEQLYPLDGLAYPDEEVTLTSLMAQDDQHQFGSLRLFTQQARRVRPDFVLTPAVVADVALICCLVQGMPLGIVLAAAWIEMLTPGEIADEIARSFTFLQDEQQGLPVRHQTLHAVFAHTWSLLTEREQSILQQSSVFRGGFTQEAAKSILGAPLPDLLALVSKFLLHRAPDGRYTIHELLRQFAAQKLSQSREDEAAAQQRHSAFFTTYLQQREDDLKGARQQQALNEIEAEGENVRVAWRWAVEYGEIACLDQAINCLGIFYEWRGRYHDGEVACQIATDKLKMLDSDDTLRIRAKILTWQTSFNRLLGQSEIANGLIKQSWRMLNDLSLADIDVRPEKAATLRELGQQAKNAADKEQYLVQSLALHRSIDDTWGIARTLYLLGGDTTDKSAHEKNPQSLAESLRLYRALGNQRGIAEVLASQGFRHVLWSQASKGEKLLQESLAICRKLGDKDILASSLGLLGIGTLFNGNIEEAHRLYSEELTLCEGLGNRARTAGALAKYSEGTAHLGRYELARTRAKAAIRIAQDINDVRGLSYALWFLGFAALAQGKLREAEQTLRESIALHQTIGWQTRQHDVLTTLGFTYLSLGKFDQAQQCLTDVLQMALKRRLFRTSVESICLAACYSAAVEEPEKAVELYTLALRYPYIANSRWFDDVAGPHIRAAAELLSPEVVAAAQQRGLVRDRWETVAELLDDLAIVER
ncbi:hypothetical protein KFU94_63355 [Chloroflexi bacterium TSY]|nr:hypothetical protein [Chloroflexi bacterium TSY]